LTEQSFSAGAHFSLKIAATVPSTKRPICGVFTFRRSRLHEAPVAGRPNTGQHSDIKACHWAFIRKGEVYCSNVEGRYDDRAVFPRCLTALFLKK